MDERREPRRVSMTDSQIDRRVVEACQRGDREAFRVLFETYQDRVYTQALYYFRMDEATAKDVTQQVFLKLFSAINGFRHEAQFTTWLYQVVFHVCADEGRKRRSIVPFVSAATQPRDGHPAESSEDRFLRRELDHDVQQAVAELKPKLRAPVLLKYLDGLSYEEIAVVLGCSKGTVASRLNRAHKILARRLEHLRESLL